jgi:hypothetical protein
MVAKPTAESTIPAPKLVLAEKHITIRVLVNNIDLWKGR